VVYDVIIAGAGPAGSVLAYLLTQHGLSVRVIEKARMPRILTQALRQKRLTNAQLTPGL